MKYKYKLDVHTHTIASGHAYSTIMENAKQASINGIELLGTTEHGSMMPNSPHIWYFHNYKVLPREMYGVMMIYGIEADIIDKNGTFDEDDDTLNRVDIVIGSIHKNVFNSDDIDDNTKAFINAIKSGKIQIVGHLGNPKIPVNYKKVIDCAKENNVLIEINNSSFTTSRKGSLCNCTKIAEYCKEINTKIVVNSDAHFCTKIGKFEEADDMLSEISFPEELIINSDKEKFISFLKSKGKLSDLK
ncbi:phosphatase [Clostridium sp. BJN0001]|uniref:phosphatase n=1 Tax=Clostridium sp. BJN0001 TaxID=2930219 RepID=UPI001FD10F44|nr:phosphatase [Clostridium sp. BJN0001]